MKQSYFLVVTGHSRRRCDAPDDEGLVTLRFHIKGRSNREERDGKELPFSSATVSPLLFRSCLFRANTRFRFYVMIRGISGDNGITLPNLKADSLKALRQMAAFDCGPGRVFLLACETLDFVCSGSASSERWRRTTVAVNRNIQATCA